MVIETVPAKLYHCGQMARRMRARHRQLIIEAGLNPHREIHQVYNASVVHRAVLFDGQLMALYGMISQHLDDAGFVWLILAEEVTVYPLAVIRECRKGLADLLRGKRELWTQILVADPAAVRLAAMLGFHTAHDGPSRPVYDKAGRGRLIAALEAIGAQFRTPGEFVTLGYHDTDEHHCDRYRGRQPFAL